VAFNTCFYTKIYTYASVSSSVQKSLCSARALEEKSINDGQSNVQTTHLFESYRRPSGASPFQKKRLKKKPSSLSITDLVAIIFLFLTDDMSPPTSFAFSNVTLFNW
jgi:hypothetical protein